MVHLEKRLILSLKLIIHINKKNMFYEFNYYHKLFYTNRIVKSVPRNLKLDRLSLAVWFMDDGSKSRSSVYFNTQQFNLNDQKTLMKLLNEFGLETSLNKIG